MADGNDREPLRIGDSLKECEDLPQTPSSACGLLEASATEDNQRTASTEGVKVRITLTCNMHASSTQRALYHSLTKPLNYRGRRRVA
jgi:hypothetical protein